MSEFSNEQFNNVFVGRLAAVELCALQEIRRLHEALARLHAENQLLRTVAEPNPEWGGEDVHEHQVLEPNGQCHRSQKSEHASGELLKSFQVMELWKKDRPVSEHVGDDTRRGPAASVREISREYRRATTLVDYGRSGVAQLVVRTAAFEYATFGLVIFNALWMAIDLDFNGKPLLESSSVFQAVEHFFVVMFSLELVLRFLAFERKRAAFLNAWFVLDFSIVVMMVLDSWLLTLIVVVSGNSSLGGLNIVSALRILRVLRIVRMMKICRFVPELGTMVSSMVAGIRAALIAGVILLAMTYGFAIALRSQSTSTAWGHEHFRSVPLSIYTLLVESLVPDNGELLAIISRESWYCGVIYAVFLLLSAILVLNMLVGMLVDVISRVSAEETEDNNIEVMSKTLQSMLRSADKDYDGLVAKAEFESIIADPKAVSTLYRVGVDVQTLAGEADVIFGTQGTSRLPFDEFVEEMLQFRRTQPATLGTIMATRRLLHMTLEQIAGRLEVLESHVYQGSSL
mmetsp:Transcript_118014/g.345624  ORF Transcript_118014/g.345624 Transcript_118014/m.345624 type:complete len:514 (-) Transcript_118014:178-1719(-)